MSNELTIFSVSELNQLAKSLLENSFKNIWVKGEISNLITASSGHIYFNLKDHSAQVKCAFFKYQAQKLTFTLKEGDEVELTGKVTLYEARGDYQITVTEVHSSGLGKLYEQYDFLKRKLEAEGLFSIERKKSIPLFPSKVGIVTSLSTAALKDVISTFKRRMKGIELIIYPTPVQGKGSEQLIAKAIELADSRKEVDALIVCRGGGSIEDLWSFNEEVVVRAVVNSSIPVISGVGHETDFTLIDFVADKRAPTPTGAAEMLSPHSVDLLNFIKSKEVLLSHLLEEKYHYLSQRLDWYSKSLVHPLDKINQVKERLKNLEDLFSSILLNRLAILKESINTYQVKVLQLQPKYKEKRLILKQLNHDLDLNCQQLIESKVHRYSKIKEVLDVLSPSKILQRGYSILTDQSGKVISSKKQLKIGQKVGIMLSDGEVCAQIHPADQQLDL